MALSERDSIIELFRILFEDSLPIKDDPFQATVIRYIGNKIVGYATGTFVQVMEKLNVKKQSDDYFKLACYKDVPNDYISDTHFGCKCRKIGGLKISEGIFCNFLLNHEIKRYLDNVSFGKKHCSFRTIVRCYLFFQDATQISKNGDKFNEWSADFFSKSPWQEVTDLTKFNEINGIYALVLDGYDKCYIGQAQNIKKRILQHWRTDRIGTYGIDLFRAKDTTRIYVFQVSKEETNQNEYDYVQKIPQEYRLNVLHGGNFDFHIKNGTMPVFQKEYSALDHIKDVRTRAMNYTAFFVKNDIELN